MADLNKIVEDLSSLTVLEAAELSKLLEEKWGVSAAAPVAVAATPAASGGEASAEEHQELSPRKLRRSSSQERFSLPPCTAALVQDRSSGLVAALRR